MKTALCIAAAAFAATATVAGEEGKMGAEAAAWNAKIEAHFKEVDANADGQVTEDELVSYMTAKAKLEFAEASGGDGSITLEEAKAHHKAKHEAMMKEHGAMDHGDLKPTDQ